MRMTRFGNRDKGANEAAHLVAGYALFCFVKTVLLKKAVLFALKPSKG